MRRWARIIRQAITLDSYVGSTNNLSNMFVTSLGMAAPCPYNFGLT